MDCKLDKTYIMDNVARKNITCRILVIVINSTVKKLHKFRPNFGTTLIKLTTPRNRDENFIKTIQYFDYYKLRSGD